MAARTGEPGRGVATVSHTGLVSQDGRSAAVSVAGVEPYLGGQGGSDDRSPWEGTAGSALTLTLSWAVGTGTPASGQFQVLEVSAVVPGAAAPGANAGHWIHGSEGVDLGASGSTTRTLRFDDLPLNQLEGAIRAGTLELYLLARRTSVAAYTISSRDVTSGNPDVNVLTQRGYVRARSKLASFEIKKDSDAGAIQTPFAYPDTTYNEITLDASLYRANAMGLSHDTPATTDQFRVQTGSASSAAQRAATWSANSGATGRVNNDYPTGAVKVRMSFSAQDFGGDTELAWADTGQPVGWSIQDPGTSGNTNRILGNEAVFDADPSLSFTAHLQLNDNSFAVADGVSPRQRLTADIGFLATRVLNARSEGVNLPGDASGGQLENVFGDDGNLTADDTWNTATSTQDGQAGWSTTLRQWTAALPGGGWTNAVTVRDAGGVQGSASLTYTLLASDPRIVVVTGGGASGDEGTHFSAGSNFIAALAPVRLDTGKLLDPTNDALSDPEAALVRLNTATGRAQYLHTTTLTWTDAGAGALTYFGLVAANLVISGGDTRVYLRTFGASGAMTTVDTSDWGEYDLIVVGKIKANSTPYGNYMQTANVGAANAHDGYAFDPTGLFK